MLNSGQKAEASQEADMAEISPTNLAIEEYCRDLFAASKHGTSHEEVYKPSHLYCHKLLNCQEDRYGSHELSMHFPF